MNCFNVYLAGVGGQGIGLLSEIILRAADGAGHRVKAVDTHGLAQRGGIVVSQIRIGPDVHTPLVPLHQADVLICLERNEAMRALGRFSKKGGTLIYYNTVWQPLDVRLGLAKAVSEEEIQATCKQIGVNVINVYKSDLKETRMQNIILLAYIDRHGLIPGIAYQHYCKAMTDLMAGTMLEKNLALYESQRKIT